MSIDPHAEFRERLGAYALELLDDDEAQRVNAHVESCTTCRALLDTVRERWPGAEADAGHPPVSALHAWVRAPERFTRLEQALLRRHLRDCPACAGDAQELRGRGDAAFVALPVRASRTWWSLAAVAALVVVAGSALVARRFGGEPMNGPVTESEGTRPPASTSSPGSGVRASVSGPTTAPTPVVPGPVATRLVRLSALQRGGAEDTTLLELGPELQEIRFVFPLTMEPNTMLDLQLFDPRGHRLLREERRYASILPPRGWQFRSVLLGEGVWRLEARPRGEATSEGSEAPPRRYFVRVSKVVR